MQQDGVSKFPVPGEKGVVPDRIHVEQVWQHLDRLSVWMRDNMAFLNLPQGGEVLVWLLKGGAGPRPLKDLYGTSRFSEPTLRGVLKSMVDDGFIVIKPSPDDRRVRTVFVTRKLLAQVEEYLRLLRAAPALFDGDAVEQCGR